MAKNWVLVLMGLGLGGLAAALNAAQKKPEGPVPVVWDHAACAHCRMHLGEPGFAAQLHQANGEIFFYDDPGCLVMDLPRRAAVHAIYFHDRHQARWWGQEEVGFMRVPNTPMGFGWAATAATATPTISFAQLRAALVPAGGRHVP